MVDDTKAGQVSPGEPDAQDSTQASSPATRKKSKTKSKKKTKKKSKRKSSRKKRSSGSSQGQGKYPRHSLEKALRIPAAILKQNAGKPCTDREASEFASLAFAGPFRVEVSSAIKYGLMDRPKAGTVGLTDRLRQILRPQKPEDELDALRAAALAAPDIGEVYSHYRGENLPDPQFFRNALVDKFKIPEDKVSEFEDIFLETMRKAQLLDEHGDKRRLLDVSETGSGEAGLPSDRIRKLGKGANVKSTDTCFVMMPFSPPIGDYYSVIYEPAIEKAGLTPVRADADIFGTGKIMDQIWRGINGAKVLVAELTGRNPNVFYELGLAHALEKPVVLVCSNEDDVPFDLTHIRVIYYEMSDPFWGNKLIEKIAENVLSAIKNPEEAVFQQALGEIAAARNG